MNNQGNLSLHSYGMQLPDMVCNASAQDPAVIMAGTGMSTTLDSGHPRMLSEVAAAGNRCMGAAISAEKGCV